MNKKPSLLSRFFSHNITLLVLAFLLAFTAWFIINANSETETNVTISDIPVVIELPDTAVEDGLKVFSVEDGQNVISGDSITASVEVAGNRVTVGSLTASDILITANPSSSIISPGKYPFSLTAKKAGLKTNYNIVSSVSPSAITVFVDKEKKQEYTIDNKIDVVVGNNYYANKALSQTKVTLTGPETMVSQIASVAVEDTLDSVDSEKTVQVQEKLYYYDQDGEKLDLPLVTADIDTVEVTITVLPTSTVRLDVNVTNAPDGYPSISIVPPTVKIAGPKDTLEKIKNNTVVIGTIDFTTLKNQGITKKFTITPPSGCKVISGENSAAVSIDLSSYDMTTVTGKITANIDTSKYSAELTNSSIDITVCGPSDLLESISTSDISVAADFTGLLDDLKSGSTKSITVPLKITLGSDYSECWVYGTYTTDVNVKKK